MIAVGSDDPHTNSGPKVGPLHCLGGAGLPDFSR
jgi:hypothetical protein